MDQLKEMVMKGKQNDVAARVREMLDKGTDPESIMKEGLIPAMDEVGDLFQKGEYFVPEMLVAARAMQKGLDTIRPLSSRAAWLRILAALSGCGLMAASGFEQPALTRTRARRRFLLKWRPCSGCPGFRSKSMRVRLPDPTPIGKT